MTLEDVSIMVVDDVNTMRVQIRELLKSFGFKKVTIAANGEDAKRLVEQEPFHLILSDWQMGPTDGLTLLKYIRSHPEYKALPFIMITAEGTKDKVVTAIQAGVDDYIVKPLTPAIIQDRIYTCLVKKGIF